MTAKPAVIGIDIGADTSFVSFVGKGVVDLVQNEVSKRATPSLVGFTDRERLLGDACLAQIKSNAKNSCRNFKHLLGRALDAPDLEVEKFWSTCPLTTAADGFAGYDVSYKGEKRVFSAPQVTAAFFTKLREITESWCQAKVADVVIGVPSYFSDLQRQAMLDAAKIAGLSVLRIMNEHTATALAYGIYRTNEFDAEKPLTVAFCSMGHSLFSVSIVKFVKGKLDVVCEKSDKVGGRDMDECLMREFAAQFKKKHGCDPLTNKKASFKLEDSVTKCKKILSANNEAPISCECLMEDEDFASNMTRDLFEKMCEPMMEKVKAVLEGAKAMSGLSVEEIDSVEVVGGASRVPWFKKMVSEAFGGKELSTTMNADESVARGCALQAAILSPLYKVREFSVNDTTNYAVSLGWMGSSADAEAVKEDGDGDTQMGGGEGEYKTAVVFDVGAAYSSAKMLSFYRKGPFDVKAEFVDEKALLPLTPKALGTYKIELPTQKEAKKVQVKVKLTQHGTFAVDTAQLVEKEEYEDKMREKRELPPDPADAPEVGEEKKDEAPKDGDAPMPDADAEGAEKKPEEPTSPKKEPEKKYEWVEVTKKKIRTKKTDLNIVPAGKPGLPETTLQQRTDEEFAIQADMKEIIETDEKRNDLEGYIFNLRDKVSDGGEYAAFITSADRDKFNSALNAAEDWLYDTFDGTKMQYIDKLDELKATGDVVAWKFKEDGMREEWISAVTGTVNNYQNAAALSTDDAKNKYGHISADKLKEITDACAELKQWLSTTMEKQSKLSKSDQPVLICADMDKKNQELAKMADKILKEPKPAPPKEEKKEETPKAEEKKEDDPPEEPKSAGPENMDVD